MQDYWRRSQERSTLGAIGMASLVVLGGFVLFGGYIEAFLPIRDGVPVGSGQGAVVARAPAVPELGWYQASVHGADVVYMGQRYEIVGAAVTMPEDQVSVAGATEEDVRLYFRNDASAAAKLPATYPESGRTGTANQWNRDASEHQGGGAGAGPYPQDKGPLYVKVGPDTFRLARPAF